MNEVMDTVQGNLSLDGLERRNVTDINHEKCTNCLLFKRVCPTHPHHKGSTLCSPWGLESR